MAGVCQLVKEAVSGLIGNPSVGGVAPIVNNIANVLGILGAADIGIQVGTGGQAGITDLPGLFNTPGIACTDPDTGEVTYVTPAQWYGNGMSCSGLKNPDQERIKKEIDEFEQRLKSFSEIKKFNPSLPKDLYYAKPEALKKLENHFRDNSGLFSGAGGGTVFDYAGILTKKSQKSLTEFSGGVFYYPPNKDKNYSLQKGSILKFDQSAFSFYGTVGGSQSPGQEMYTGPNYIVYDCYYRLNGSIIGSPLNVSLPAAPNNSFISIQVSPQSYTFKPVGTPSPGAYIPLVYTPLTTHDPSTPCDNRGKQPMPCQTCKLTPDLINKINALYKATGADKLGTGTYTYNPEKEIKGWGRQIYTNPNSSATVRPSNLIDIIASTIAAEFHRLGLQRLPAELPESLIPKTNKLAEAFDKDTIKVNNLLSFHEQIFKLQDEVLGQWPIEFKVTDDGKTNDVKLWNLSEAVAELYGMQTKVVEDSDLAVHWGVRAATEATKANNSALKGLHLLTEFVKFTGCITTPGSLTVNCTFTPDPVAKQTNEQMLMPSQQTVIVTNIVDGSSILELLKTISYASQIAAKAVLQPIKNNPTTGQPSMPGDFIKTERKKRKIDDKAFEVWKQEKEKPITNIPPEQYPPGYKVPSIEIKPQPGDKK